MARFIPVVPFPYTADDARDWLAGAPERWNTSRELSLALTLIDADELLGVVSVSLRDGESIGYWLRPCARGQALTAEAVTAIASWATNEHGVHGLFITAHPQNVASQRVAERAGFVQVGVVDHKPPFRDGVSRALRFELPHGH